MNLDRKASYGGGVWVALSLALARALLSIRHGGDGRKPSVYSPHLPSREEAKGSTTAMPEKHFLGAQEAQNCAQQWGRETR